MKRFFWVSLAMLTVACHTTPIPNPPVPPITQAPRTDNTVYDYSEKGVATPARILKKRLAVARFVDNIPVKESPFGERREVDVVTPNAHVHQEEIVPEKYYVPEEFSEKLIDSLSRTNKFVLVERKDINPMLREMSFSEAKWVDKEKSAKVGKVLGAQMIVTGAMDLNDDATRSTNPYRLYLRMYDVETSRISGTTRATGKTVQEVIDRAVSQIVTTMDSVPWVGKIASVSGNTAYLNAGTSENVQIGDKFKLFSLGKTITDPDSKETIGYEEEPAGSAEVVSVTDRVATLKLVDTSRPIKEGDKAQPKN